MTNQANALFYLPLCGEVASEASGWGAAVDTAPHPIRLRAATPDRPPHKGGGESYVVALTGGISQ